MHNRGDKSTFLFVYIDDILITGSNIVYMNYVKQYLNDKLPVKDLGTVKFFIGIEIMKTAKRTYTSQGKYVRDILECAGISEVNLLQHLCLKGLS